MVGRLRVLEAGAAMVVGFLVLAPMVTLLWPAGADAPVDGPAGACSGAAEDPLAGKGGKPGKGKDKGWGDDGSDRKGSDGDDDEDEDDDREDDDRKDKPKDGEGKDGRKGDGRGRDEGKAKSPPVTLGPAPGDGSLSPAAPSVAGPSC